MNTVTDLGDCIARLTLTDAVQVRTYLKDRYGIEAAVSLGNTPRPVVTPPPPSVEADSFDVLLDAVDPGKKITVIKTVRELTGVGLVEAKGVVEAAPRVLRAGADKADAERLKATLEAAGAKVTLRAA